MLGMNKVSSSAHHVKKDFDVRPYGITKHQQIHITVHSNIARRQWAGIIGFNELRNSTGLLTV